MTDEQKMKYDASTGVKVAARAVLRQYKADPGDLGVPMKTLESAFESYDRTVRQLDKSMKVRAYRAN